MTLATCADQRQATNIAARIQRTSPSVLAWCAGVLVPIKAARFDVAGLSLYFSFLLAAIVFVRYHAEVLGIIRHWFLTPLAVLWVFAAWAVLRGAGVHGPLTTYGKLLIAFITTATFVCLLRRAEGSLYLGLFSGVTLSVVYMAYQWISSVFFGFRLPYTTSGRWQIGLGLSSRYGLSRVTGFTEEPSFIATMLVGAVLLLMAHSARRGHTRWLKTAAFVGIFGLALCTSNNLFATTFIIAGSWILVRRRRVVPVLFVYYLAALAITPYVLTRDITYFTRFSPYDIFLRSTFIDQIFGRGLGSYPAYFERQQVSFGGVDVRSLASVWGGFLFDGGVVLVALVVFWLARVIRNTTWPEGLSLLALLLMLSNYNSPWWPLVSLALAQCLVQQRKDPRWTTISTSATTRPVFGATPSVSERSHSLA